MSSARFLRSSVVFRYPFGDSSHFVCVPKRFIRSALFLKEQDAFNLESDLRSWVNLSNLAIGSCLQFTVNYGKYQETPFLHIHAIVVNVSYNSDSCSAREMNKAWFAGICDGFHGSGRRIIYYFPGSEYHNIIDRIE